MRVGAIAMMALATMVAAIACDTDPHGIATSGVAGIGGPNGSAGRATGGVGGSGGSSGSADGGRAGSFGGTAGAAGSINTGGAGSPAGCTLIDSDTSQIAYEGCTREYCTLEEALVGHAEFECSLQDSSERLTLTSGCGFYLLRRAGGFSGSYQIFDAATHREVGYGSFNDVPQPPCNTLRHRAGKTFPVDCATYTICSVCEALAGVSNAPGDAGAGGESGGGGAGGAGSCLDGLL